MSLFRAIYDRVVVPVVMCTFADETVPAVYRIGNTAVDLRLIDRGERIEIETDLDGDEIKRYRKQVVISTDPDSPWGGVRNPQLTAQIEIDGVAWSVAPAAGLAVESATDSFSVINLVRSAGVSKSYVNGRRD